MGNKGVDLSKGATQFEQKNFSVSNGSRIHFFFLGDCSAFT